VVTEFPSPRGTAILFWPRRTVKPGGALAPAGSARASTPPVRLARKARCSSGGQAPLQGETEPSGAVADRSNTDQEFRGLMLDAMMRELYARMRRHADDGHGAA